MNIKRRYLTVSLTIYAHSLSYETIYKSEGVCLIVKERLDIGTIEQIWNKERPLIYDHY